MNTRAYKEYEPVRYPENGVKVLYDARVEPGAKAFPLHWHERMELIRVVEGSLECHVDDTRFIVKTGELAIACPCRPHGAAAGREGARYHTVMFDPADFYNASGASRRYLTAICDSTAEYAPCTGDSRVLGVLDGLVSLCRSEGRGTALYAVGRVYELLGVLYDRCLLNESPSRLADARFREVFEYIEAHYTEPLTLDALSCRFGYNKAYFCRRFKEVAGISAMRYITILRLEQARRLLERQESVGGAAIACGFCNISHFSNAFRGHYGVAPSTFRKGSSVGGDEAPSAVPER